jgi:hypothetical protein
MRTQIRAPSGTERGERLYQSPPRPSDIGRAPAMLGIVALTGIGASNWLLQNGLGV